MDGGNQGLAANVSEPAGFILRVWLGRAPLGRVFWLYGIGGSAFLGGLFLLTRTEDNLVGQQSVLLLLALHTVWILGAIWRSAYRADSNYWHASARALTLAWAMNAILLLGFFEVELLAKCFA